MYVNVWYYWFLYITSWIGILSLIIFICFLFQEHKERKRLKEHRLLKIEEDIRYLKGIGSIEK